MNKKLGSASQFLSALVPWCLGGLKKSLFLCASVPLWLIFVLPGAAAAAEPVAVLQGLDKVTARVSRIEAPLGRMVRFGSLEIIPRACHKAPPEEPPESAAFLEIRAVDPGEDPVDLFSGWMFASSPALSALEHPVYDIWVLDCRSSLE